MSTATKQLAGQYDSGMSNALLNEYYGNSGFFNYGYWREGTPDQATACANLVEELLQAIPNKAGKILDVACGLGASSQHLTRYYPVSAITGVNISAHQLLVCRRRSPDIDFLQMDAARLGFGDNIFDTVLCVEAAFHFDTRERFLHEAYGILKPGGWLALSDILFLGMPGRRRRRLPNQNFVTDLQQYRMLYEKAGFSDVHVTDATVPCWVGFRNHLMQWGWQKLQAGDIDFATWSKHMLRLLVGTIAIRKYVLVWARKPN